MFSPQSWCEAAARPRPHHSVAGGHAVEPDKRQLSLFPGRAGSPRRNRFGEMKGSGRGCGRLAKASLVPNQHASSKGGHGTRTMPGHARSCHPRRPRPSRCARGPCPRPCRCPQHHPFGRDCYSHFTARQQEPVPVPWLSGWPSNPWGSTLLRSVTGAPHAGSLLSGTLESGGRCPNKTKFAGGFS